MSNQARDAVREYAARAGLTSGSVQVCFRDANRKLVESFVVWLDGSRPDQSPAACCPEVGAAVPAVAGRAATDGTEAGSGG